MKCLGFMRIISATLPTRRPAGRGWIHEIQAWWVPHHGPARRGSGAAAHQEVKGNKFSNRFPQIVAALTDHVGRRDAARPEGCVLARARSRAL